MNPDELRGALERLHDQSFAWALSCCAYDHEQARDVLQTSYLKAISGAARYEERATVKTWLFAVIRNTAASARRSRLVRQRLLALWRGEPQVAVGHGPEDGADASTGAVRAALARLSPRQREVLHLVFYQDMTIQAASEVMGVRLGTARQHYERGKRALRRQLEEREAAYA